MHPVPTPKHRSWKHRFADAVRGIGIAVRSQPTLRVHCLAAFTVVGLGLFKGCAYWQSTVLALCCTLVIVAEMLNSAMECLARAITPKPDAQIRDALDMASGAVLTAAAGAVVVGIYVFVLT